MFAFKTEVRLNTNAPPEAIVARLAKITAAPRTFSSSERCKPLRGRTAAEDGFLRWPIQYGSVSPRNLNFDIIKTSNGSTLVGAFKLWLPLRLVASLWLLLGCVAWFSSLIRDLGRHAGLRAVGTDFLIVLMMWCMASGYLWVFVYVGKSRDQGLIRILRYVLGSEAGVSVVNELFASGIRTESFVDEPTE